MSVQALVAPPASAPSPTPAWVDVAVELDALLFLPGSLWGLQADNTRVPGVIVPTVRRGLELVDQGSRIASIVGTLRPEFLAVDVDVDGELGRAVTDQLSRWLRGQRSWHLVRPSGGAAGRHHLYVHVVDAAAAESLHRQVETLRARHGLAYRFLDVRRSMRLLSAPHRRGTRTRPLGHLPQALRALTRHRLGRDATSAEPSSPRRPQHHRYWAEPLTPLPRASRSINPEWAAYAATGQRPHIGGGDHTQSTYELRLAAELLHAGHDAETAWTVLEAAHQSATSHLMHPSRGRGWWVRYVWNRLVKEDLAWRAARGLLETAPGAELTERARTAIAGGRAALERLLYRCGPHQRHSVYLVGSLILDRAQRTGQTTIPVPQRDLAVDAGLGRPAVAAALERLDGVLGVLERTFDPADREKSSHTFAIYRTDVGGVGQLLPPVSHAPTGSWHRVSPTAHSLWRHLPLADGSGLTLEDLAQLSGLAHGSDLPPTVTQVRTARHHLAALAEAGLATCDDQGRWTHSPSAEAWSSEHVEAARGAAADVVERIAHEREAYRTAPGSSWRQQRADALARDRAQAAARYAAWRAGLGPDELRERSRRYAAAFDGLPTESQAAVKQRLADARRRRGEPSEAERHDAWCRSMAPLDYADRVAARHVAYLRLTPQQQAERVAAWATHRHRWKVPQGHPSAAIQC